MGFPVRGREERRKRVGKSKKTDENPRVPSSILGLGTSKNKGLCEFSITPCFIMLP
jgi:hypothetical protein